MTAHAAPPSNDALDQARRFLARTVAWPKANESYICIIWFETKPDHDKSYWTGRAVRTLDEAINTLKWIGSQAGTRDIYVCMSSQRLAQEKTSKAGRKYLAPIRNQQNVLALKSLFIDIDFKGGDHGYDTQDEAVKAIAAFIKTVALPKPSVIVKSGGGVHIHYTLSQPLPRDEWQPLAHALAEAGKRHGLKADWQVTIDSARILRIPGTMNNKYDIPRPVTWSGNPSQTDYTVERLWQALAPYRVAQPAATKPLLDPALFPPRPPLPAGVDDALSAGIDRRAFEPVRLDDLAAECSFIREAIATGGRTYTNPMWNLTTLMATFTDDARNDAHRMGNQYPGYTQEATDEFFDRKVRDAEEKGLGFPLCATISGTGCSACQTCPHFSKGRSPLAALPRKVIVAGESPSFADPYSQFVGPPFPTRVLPSVLADFVEAEHRAMGADAAALAMGAIAAIGAAVTSETRVQVSEGWHERPILWVALVGEPSTMKSPVIAKVTKPLVKIDSDRDAQWRTAKAAWDRQKANGSANPTAYPAKPSRCIIHDATPEKTAEILARGPAGSLMMLDELAGWMGSFDRYGSGNSSRAFYLSAFNGGPHLKDRVGKGIRDENAEIRVENLALSILGGVQPDRLASLRDLTSDGLLQRFLVVLMAPAERGNEKHPVAAIEARYASLIQSVQAASARKYQFAPDALPVLSHVLDRLYQLEQVDGFPSALIGAIGKLKGYYARLALILQVASDHCAIMQGQQPAISASVISVQSSKASERLLFDFLLPHTFGLYDVVANGGQDRDTVRAIGDFILASDKDRIRPSDITSGVRRLRNQPAHKVAEWASRFCALGWLRAEGDSVTDPKAWLVAPDLRTYFAVRRQQARKARAEAHAILKAGGRP